MRIDVRKRDMAMINLGVCLAVIDMAANLSAALSG
jgi:hypothetical protein